MFSFLLVFTLSTQAQWVKTASSPKGSGITDLAVKQSNGYLFATTGSFDWPNADTGGVHRSTDGGNTWTRVFPAYVARVIDVTPDGNIWASVWDFPNEDESMYSSSDDGDTWVLRYDGAPNNNIFSFAYDPANPQRMWLGIRSAIVLSNDGGQTWSHLTAVNIGWWIVQVVVQPPAVGSGRVFVIARNPATFEDHVYWNDAPPGIGWTAMTGDEPTDTLVSMIIVKDSTDSFGREVDGLYVGTLNGRIYKAGVYRPAIPPPASISLVYEDPDGPSITAFAEIDFTEAADGPAVSGPGTRKHYSSKDDDDDDDGPASGGSSGGVVKSIDLGQTWETVNDGLPATDVRMSAIAAHITSGVTATVYAGMFLNQNDGGPVYVQEVIGTDVNPESPGIPSSFVLNQNYPNPFNPSTEISFQVSDFGLVEVSIFDLLGRKVATLVNEKKHPGSYQVTWDATGQPSGVYFYRLSTTDFVQTKKLVLLR